MKRPRFHVGFSIDEADGANAASSFDGTDHKPAMVAFLRRLLSLAFSESYPLHVRDIERIARVLADQAPAHNEQVRPWDVIAAGKIRGAFRKSAATASVARMSEAICGVGSPACRFAHAGYGYRLAHGCCSCNKELVFNAAR